MNDLIDREELKKAIKRIESLPWGDEEGNRVEFEWTSKELESLIDKAPSAEPKIIHCGECAFAEVLDIVDVQDGYVCQFHPGSIWFSDSFCSWAKERDGNE